MAVRPRFYAYHGTNHLSAIVRLGALIPGDASRFGYGPRLYLHTDAWRARGYGKHVLRFLWPTDALYDGDDWCSDDEWYIARPVSINEIQLFTGECWEMLADVARKASR